VGLSTAGPESHDADVHALFTRRTNGFSKKLENDAAMVSLYSMYYNSGCVHQTLLVTPAMEPGIADHVWSIGENRRAARFDGRSK
jgi:hypothetical protein